jgi:hypothetical protein
MVLPYSVRLNKPLQNGTRHNKDKKIERRYFVKVLHFKQFYMELDVNLMITNGHEMLLLPSFEFSQRLVLLLLINGVY